MFVIEAIQLLHCDPSRNLKYSRIIKCIPTILVSELRVRLYTVMTYLVVKIQIMYLMGLVFKSKSCTLWVLFLDSMRD